MDGASVVSHHLWDFLSYFGLTCTGMYPIVPYFLKIWWRNVLQVLMDKYEWFDVFVLAYNRVRKVWYFSVGALEIR